MPKADRDGVYTLNGGRFKIRAGAVLPAGAKMVPLEQRGKGPAPENKSQGSSPENKSGSNPTSSPDKTDDDKKSGE